MSEGPALNRKYHQLRGLKISATGQFEMLRSGFFCRLPALHVNASKAFLALREFTRADRVKSGSQLPYWYELRTNQGEPVPATVLTIWRSKKGEDGLMLSECIASSGPAPNECHAILRALIDAINNSR